MSVNFVEKSALSGVICLSHQLVAGCDTGVRISVSPSVCQQFMSILAVHFSVAVIAGSVKPCIVIVFDILFKHAL